MDRDGEGQEWAAKQSRFVAGPSLSNKDQTRNACPTVGRIEARHPEELPAVSASETNRNGERGGQCSLLKAVWMGKSI